MGHLAPSGGPHTTVLYDLKSQCIIPFPLDKTTTNICFCLEVEKVPISIYSQDLWLCGGHKYWLDTNIFDPLLTQNKFGPSRSKQRSKIVKVSLHRAQKKDWITTVHWPVFLHCVTQHRKVYSSTVNGKELIFSIFLLKKKKRIYTLIWLVKGISDWEQNEGGCLVPDQLSSWI